MARRTHDCLFIYNNWKYPFALMVLHYNSSPHRWTQQSPSSPHTSNSSSPSAPPVPPAGRTVSSSARPESAEVFIDIGPGDINISSPFPKYYALQYPQ
ncbi:hypothetical protein GWI33_016835 [Rhynchophorus ferrugineus]|uniref:Uncharacterized protein n=1 Tax=Rhynchophorus ferrugineus TaxID=354439 RepID=A0A834M892_RHYFE|nr:hypothetical protein GWI33_016835 [Rhynchophorus ferrugineus]